MSADLLRRAAATMRERAGAADALGQVADTITTATCQEFADHITSWAPPVALYVATLLETIADEPWCCDEDKYDPVNDNRVVLAAVALAGTYLGEESS